MKHYLNLEREVQLRDYDSIVGHVTIVMVRYVFLSFEQRCHDDPRTLGSPFLACSEKLQDLTLLEVMERLLALATEKIRSESIAAGDVVLALVNKVMTIAVEMLESGRRLSKINSAILAG